jgi:lipid-A-disaccharide synthase-like uncharacterized protein
MRSLAVWWATVSLKELLWLVLGMTAQLMFTLRFVVQWIASERARRSVVPETFWYLSLAGGLMLLLSAIYRLDPVFILGQASGLFIYARNIVFIREHKRSVAPARSNSVRKNTAGPSNIAES